MILSLQIILAVRVQFHGVPLGVELLLSLLHLAHVDSDEVPCSFILDLLDIEHILKEGVLLVDLSLVLLHVGLVEVGLLRAMRLRPVV